MKNEQLEKSGNNHSSENEITPNKTAENNHSSSISTTTNTPTPTPPSSSTQSITGNTNKFKARVLLAEDTAIQGKKVQFQLNKLGYEVVWVLNGKEATRKLWTGDFDISNDNLNDKATSRNTHDLESTISNTKHLPTSSAIYPTFDVVITDVQMPELSGIELLKKIKSHPDTTISNLPVIIMTSFGTEDVCSESITVGADDFINKPFRGEEIDLRISNILERNRAASESNLRLQAIESSMDGMAILDRKGHYLFANQAHVNMLAYSNIKELQGVNWSTHYKTEDHFRLNEIIHCLAQKGRWWGEITAKKKDGTLFYQEMSLTLIDQNLMAMISRDISKRKASEQLVDMMINSLGQGLVVFNQQGKCLPNFTLACIDLFGKNPQDKYIWELLEISPKQVNDFKAWVTALYEQKIPFKDLARLGPTHLLNNSKYISLQYLPLMMDKGNSLSGVIVVATDKTEEEKAKVTAKQNQDYAELVINLAKNKKQVLSFISDANEMLYELDQIVQGPKWSVEEIKRIKILLHSIKGGAGIYSLTKLQTLVHSYESELDPFKAENNLDLSNGKFTEKIRKYWPKFQQNITQIKELFNQYITEFSSFLGAAVIDGQNRVEISVNELKIFHRELIAKIGKSNPLTIKFNNQFIRSAIISFFQGYDYLLGRRAQKKNILLDPIIFVGGEVAVDGDYYGELFTVLKHAFINIIDHGIEPTEERTQKGKPERGRIKVAFSIQAYQGYDSLKIVIQDDGRGIDPQKIRERLVKNGYNQEMIESDDYHVIQHIFDDSFSTSDTVGLTSGRGIGMTAIKNTTEKLGGAAVVHSVVGKGSRLTILVPYV